MRLKIAFAATLLAAVCLARPSTADAARRRKVAVMDVVAVQHVPEGTARILTNIVGSEVTALREYDVISTVDISSMLGYEKQKQLLGCEEDTSCLAEIGGALGADYMLKTHVGKVGTRYHIQLRVYEMKRARMLADESRFAPGDEDALVDATQQAVRAVFQ
ncbi:MAG: hypothetical protein ACK4N5_19075, partial [Myxococcales bacterium]